MAAQLYDTQQGATLSLVTDALSLRILDIEALKYEKAVLDITHLGTITARPKLQGDLKDYKAIKVKYQNSPSIANPSNTVQTFLITGPVPPGGSTGEIITGTGFVHMGEDNPSYSATAEALQTKEFTFIYDASTGPTRTAAS